MTPRCGYNLHNLYVYLCEECNLSCAHCWQSSRPAPSPEHPLSAERCCDFIDEAVPLGLKYVKISGGEPLLRRETLTRIVAHTRRRQIRTRVETNGTLVDAELAETLRTNKVAVSVSLDGSTDRTHQMLRRTDRAFEAALRGLELLRAADVETEIIFCLHRGNKEDLPAVVRLANDTGCTGVKVNPVMASGRGVELERQGLLLSAAELHAFVDWAETDAGVNSRIFSLSTTPAFHRLRWIREGRVGGGHCCFTNLLGLLADGSVSFCGMGYRSRDYRFMRAGTDALDTIWNEHHTLTTVRQLIPARLEGVCGNCLMRSTCQGGCRAQAYEVYSSLTAPSPPCQELYEAGLFPISRLSDPRSDCSYFAQAAHSGNT